jgi:Polyketide cyclase / dehydrase and lipid transport
VRTTVEASVTIGRPPEAVTRVILDPTKAVLWTSDLEDFEVVAGEPGQVGAVGLLHYLRGGRRYVMEDTLMVADLNERYVSRDRGQGLSAQVETLLTPRGDGETLLTVRWSGRGTRPLMWVLLPFMRRAVARGARHDLNRLKDLVERVE